MEVPTGRHIKRWRKSLDITQSQLSDLSGVAQSIITKVETETVDPRSSTLRKIVEALSRSENPEKLHTVRDVMVTDVAVLKFDDVIQTAIDNMVKDGISQLPVLSEEPLLRALSLNIEACRVIQPSGRSKMSRILHTSRVQDQK